MKKTVRDIDVSGKRVLVRADLNVPLNRETGQILDDSRIRSTMPTLNYLLSQGARVIICSHLGRPEGRFDPALSIRPVAHRLSKALQRPVQMASCCVGREAQSDVLALKAGDILLLENLRFHPEEESNDPKYAKGLADLAQIFANDAFGVAHRSHASTVGVAAHLPTVAGMLMEKEIDFLERASRSPERPYAALIGGAKVSTKIGAINCLLGVVDKILLGGGIANTFLAAEGFDVGTSLVDSDCVETAKKVMDQAAESRTALLLPTDVIIADRMDGQAQTRHVSVRDVPTGWQILDIGETTAMVFAKALEGCKMVFWNGPMGMIESPSFAHGSHRMAGVIAGLKTATTILGGGETAVIARGLGMEDHFSHISTGGGASLEFIEGRPLPGVTILPDK